MTELQQLDIVKFRTLSEPDAGFAYDGIRQDLDEIPTESQEIAREIVELIHSEALEGAPIALAGAHAYERKSFLDLDRFGGERNSYGRSTDDVLLQVTVRVSQRKAQELIAKVTEERIAQEEAKAIAKRAEIDAQIARLQAQRDAI